MTRPATDDPVGVRSGVRDGVWREPFGPRGELLRVHVVIHINDPTSAVAQ